MVKRVSAAEAKAHLSALTAEVAFGGQHVIIERRGKPLAALVSVAEMEYLEQGRPSSPTPLGALALVGAWQTLTDRALDSLVEDIYVQREKDKGRPVSLED